MLRPLYRKLDTDTLPARKLFFMNKAATTGRLIDCKKIKVNSSDLQFILFTHVERKHVKHLLVSAS